jgi:Mn2+/Fe2+ NRAMP family transporter
MFVPHITWSKDAIILICALLGTTISPYLFFWQTSQEVEEKRSAKKLHNDFDAVDTNIRNDIAMSDMRFDVWSGMFFSNLVMFFIITVCGSVLYPEGITSIETAGDAAKALLPIAGDKAYLLFTLGIVGTGLLAVPILAGLSAYALAEALNVRQGLGYTYKEAKAFYLIIIVSMALGLLMLFSGLPPMKALFYSAVLNGVIAPVLLFIIVYISSQEKIMGEWKNTKLQSFLGWIITGVMGVASILTLFFLLA